MSKCIHTVFENGKPVFSEVMHNKGYFDEPSNIEHTDSTKENNTIWEYRREFGDNFRN